MCGRPPGATRADTPFPYTSLCRSVRRQEPGGDVLFEPAAGAPRHEQRKRLLVQQMTDAAERLAKIAGGELPGDDDALGLAVADVAELRLDRRQAVGCDKNELLQSRRESFLHRPPHGCAIIGTCHRAAAGTIGRSESEHKHGLVKRLYHLVFTSFSWACNQSDLGASQVTPQSGKGCRPPCINKLPDRPARRRPCGAVF